MLASTHFLPTGLLASLQMQSAAQNSLRSIEKLPLNSTWFESINPKNKLHYAAYTRIDLNLDSSVCVLDGNSIGLN